MALLVGAASILLGVALNPLLQGVLIFYGEHSQNGDADAFRVVSSAIIKRRTVRVAVLVAVVGYPLSFYFGLYWATPLLVIGLLVVDVVRVFEQRLFAASRRKREIAITAGGDAWFRLCFVWGFLHALEPTPYAAILGNLLGASLFVYVMRMSIRLEAYSGQKVAVSRQLKSGITNAMHQMARPLLPSMILANLTEMGSRYLISAVLGLHAAGLFAVGYGFVKRPYAMLANIAEMTVTPILRDGVTRGNAEEVLRARRYSILLISAISIIGALLFFAFGEYLVMIFLSRNYAELSGMLFGLAVAITLFNVANVFNWFSLTLGDSRAVLLNNVIGSAATTVLTIALCFMHGLIGAVWAMIIGYGMQLAASIVTYNACKRRIQLSQV